jgi:predicted nucleotidyltransferase
MEIIKPIIKVGNSAGVLLPRGWLDGEAKITLVRKSRNINKEILDILQDDLPSIIGLYLVGSHARHENTSKSDIDILGITANIDKKIKKGKYEIVLISEKNLENELKNNILPLLPMLREASSIINKDLIEEFRNIPITKENLNWHLSTTLSALKLIKGSIDLAKEDKERMSDNIIYSLILRLREVYIVKCLIHGKIAYNSELKKIIKDNCGSLNAYDAYRRSKSGLKSKRTVTIKEAESLYEYVLLGIEEQKEWIKRKG